MNFGYMRVSTIDQNLDRQEQQLRGFGCEQVFFEKITGLKRNRPELNQMLEYLRPGDTVVVTDLTRLSRSTKDLIFAGIAQFERDLISERTKEGITAARKRGKHPGRPTIDQEKLNYAFYLVEQGITLTEAAEKAGVSRMTLYRKLKK